MSGPPGGRQGRLNGVFTVLWVGLGGKRKWKPRLMCRCAVVDTVVGMGMGTIPELRMGSA